MLEKIKAKLKQNDFLYCAYYYLHHRKDSCADRNFPAIIRAAYDREDSANLMILHHFGDARPNDIVYNISTGEGRPSVGFGAELHHLLYGLRFADFIHAVPRVIWGSGTFYYDAGMDGHTKNVFTYYFEPVSDLAERPVTDYRNVIFHDRSHTKMFHDMAKYAYRLDDDDTNVLADQYRKSIRLNPATDRFVSDGVSRTVAGKRMLGVHVRGTDFKVGFFNHPKIVDPQTYLDAVVTEFRSGGGQYDGVFLATDDSDALALFRKEFGARLVYYDDVFRTAGTVGPHYTENDRPLHRYKLGLEVLRDIYTLAGCGGLICGLSHTAFAARYVKVALGGRFDRLTVLDQGINR